MVTGRRRGSGVVALFCVLLLAVGMSACGGDDDDGPGIVAGMPSARMNDAVLGLCAARDMAEGDVQSARTAFYDRSHEPLHSLAGALEPVDRPLVARLLESKEAVEAALESGAPTLKSDLDRLIDVTRAALVRLSASSPRCP